MSDEPKPQPAPLPPGQWDDWYASKPKPPPNPP